MFNVWEGYVRFNRREWSVISLFLPKASTNCCDATASQISIDLLQRIREATYIIIIQSTTYESTNRFDVVWIEGAIAAF